MIAIRVLFYKLTEIALDGFFNSVFKNFRKLDIEDGIQISIENVKVGDRFYRILEIHDIMTWEFIDVTIERVFSDKIVFRYLYKIITYDRYDDSIYYTGNTSKDLSDMYCKDVERDNWECGNEEYEWDSNEFSISKGLFHRIFNEIKPFIEYDYRVLFLEDDKAIGYK